jgi:HEAT repeat protein
VNASNKKHYPHEHLFPEIRKTISDDGKMLHGIVLEYIKGQTGAAYLESLMKNDSCMTPEQFVTFLKTGLAGVDCMQKAGIRHRDLNTRNLMIDDQGKVTLIDFNFSKKVDKTALTTIEPEGFYPMDAYGPEGGGSTVESYAIGMIGLSLYTKKLPYALLKNNQVNQEGVDLDPALKTFIGKLCADKASDRYPNAAEALVALQALDSDSCKVERPVNIRKVEHPVNIVLPANAPEQLKRMMGLSKALFWSPTSLCMIANKASKFGEAGLPVLSKLADSRSFLVRKHVAKKLTLIESIGSSEILSSLLDDENESVVTAAWSALEPKLANTSQYGDAALPLLEKLADSKHSNVRLAVVSTAAKHGEAGLPVLSTLADSSDSDVRAAVAKVLGDIPGAGSLQMLGVLAKDDFSDVLSAVPSAAAKHGEAGLPVLSTLADSRYNDVRAAVAKVLGDIPGAGSLQILGVLAKDFAWDVVKTVITSAAKHGEAGLPVLSTLADSSGNVRVAVAKVLGDIPGAGSLKILGVLAKDNNKYVCSAVITAAAKHGEAGLPVLSTLADSSNSDVCAAVAKVLGNIPGEGSLKILGVLAKGYDEDVHIFVVSAAAKHGEAGLPVLSTLAHKSNRNVRAAVAEVLGDIPGAGSLQILGVLAKDGVWGVVKTVITAAAKHGEAGLPVLTSMLAGDLYSTLVFQIAQTLFEMRTRNINIDSCLPLCKERLESFTTSGYPSERSKAKELLAQL